jgi:hypothetical protein
MAHSFYLFNLWARQLFNHAPKLGVVLATVRYQYLPSRYCPVLPKPLKPERVRRHRIVSCNTLPARVFINYLSHHNTRSRVIEMNPT